MAARSGVARLLGALSLGWLVALGLGTALPAAHADTPSPPPASTPAEPADEPVGGGDRTLTWLALAGAGTIALAAGGIVVVAGRNRDRSTAGVVPQVRRTAADHSMAETGRTEDAGAAAVAQTGGLVDVTTRREPEPLPLVGATFAGVEPEFLEVAPRRGLVDPGDPRDAAQAAQSWQGGLTPPTASSAPPARRAAGLEAFQLDDPLTLDSGIRPRRALGPIPDSSTFAAATVEDTSWSDWYEASDLTVRRGRRALPRDHDPETGPEPDGEGDDEIVPRRARG